MIISAKSKTSGFDIANAGVAWEIREFTWKEEKVSSLAELHSKRSASFIMLLIKYIFIICLFRFTNIDIFLHKLGQTL